MTTKNLPIAVTFTLAIVDVSKNSLVHCSENSYSALLSRVCAGQKKRHRA